MTHKLMVKTHNKTGLKYLCKTDRDDPHEYKGSGTYWKRHLAEHGDDITTEIIFETADMEEFKVKGLYYSNLWNIVTSKEWANLTPEQGSGGDTVSNKFWITNGEVDQYLNKGEEIPDGWKKGRSTGAFKNSEMQREFSRRVDRTKSSERLRSAWAEGRFVRDHSKCGRKGDLHPAKRQEVKDKISLRNSKPVTVKGVNFKSINEAVTFFNVKRHVIDRWRKDEGSY